MSIDKLYLFHPPRDPAYSAAKILNSTCPLPRHIVLFRTMESFFCWLIKTLAVLAETAAAGDCIMYIRIGVKAADNAFCCISYNRLWQRTLRRAEFPKSNVPNTTERHISSNMPDSSVQSAIKQFLTDTSIPICYIPYIPACRSTNKCTTIR